MHLQTKYWIVVSLSSLTGTYQEATLGSPRLDLEHRGYLLLGACLLSSVRQSGSKGMWFSSH